MPIACEQNLMSLEIVRDIATLIGCWHRLVLVIDDEDLAHSCCLDALCKAIVSHKASHDGNASLARYLFQACLVQVSVEVPFPHAHAQSPHAHHFPLEALPTQACEVAKVIDRWCLASSVVNQLPKPHRLLHRWYYGYRLDLSRPAPSLEHHQQHESERVVVNHNCVWRPCRKSIHKVCGQYALRGESWDLSADWRNDCKRGTCGGFPPCGGSCGRPTCDSDKSLSRIRCIWMASPWSECIWKDKR